MFGGMNIAVSGNVPQGAGLSSSASLEVVIGQTVKALYDLPVSREVIALNGQQAENQFVGCNCGIMDQLISACGEDGHALLIDCRSPETRAVAMPENSVVMIINSNKNAAWWTANTTPGGVSVRRQRSSSAFRRCGM